MATVPVVLSKLVDENKLKLLESRFNDGAMPIEDGRPGLGSSILASSPPAMPFLRMTSTASESTLKDSSPAPINAQEESITQNKGPVDAKIPSEANNIASSPNSGISDKENSQQGRLSGEKRSLNDLLSSEVSQSEVVILEDDSIELQQNSQTDALSTGKSPKQKKAAPSNNHEQDLSPSDAGSRGTVPTKERTIVSYFTKHSDSSGTTTASTFTASTNSTIASTATGGNSTGSAMQSKAFKPFSTAVAASSTSGGNSSSTSTTTASTASSTLATINELKKTIDQIKVAKDQAEVKAQRFEAEGKILAEKLKASEDKNSRCVDLCLFNHTLLILFN